MKLYFAPLACSLATRIALYEAGAEAGFIQVNTHSKKVHDGSDFFAINALGQVPVLRMENGELLTENTAILPYVADCYPEAGLAPTDAGERARMQQWLGFVSTELHKAVFVPLLDPKAGEEVKAYARAKVPLRLGVLQDHLATHAFLVGQFSVADAYLFTVLNWARHSGVDLAAWPLIADYYRRLSQRPAVARALSEEMATYLEEQALKVAS
jgi:glutathione S-transferase